MNTNKGFYELEKQINARLRATPAERRPEMSTRRRIQSVAYQANGAFQATDANGNVETITLEAAKALLH